MRPGTVTNCGCSYCTYDEISTPDTAGEYAGIDEHIARLTAESSRLRTALERIAEYEMNWAAGPSENLNNVQAIAEAALTPTTGGTPATCARVWHPEAPMSDPKPLSRFAVFALLHDTTKNLSQKADEVWTSVSGLQDQLFAARGNRLAADAECAATMEDMRRLRTALERATELLQRWAVHAKINWHDHTTTRIVDDTHSFLATPTTGGAPATCASWCGTKSEQVPAPGPVWWHDYYRFCTLACRDAGRPLNPAPAPRCDTCGEHLSKICPCPRCRSTPEEPR